MRLNFGYLSVRPLFGCMTRQMQRPWQGPVSMSCEDAQATASQAAKQQILLLLEASLLLRLCCLRTDTHCSARPQAGAGPFCGCANTPQAHSMSSHATHPHPLAWLDPADLACGSGTSRKATPRPLSPSTPHSHPPGTPHTRICPPAAIALPKLLHRRHAAGELTTI